MNTPLLINLPEKANVSACQSLLDHLLSKGRLREDLISVVLDDSGRPYSLNYTHHMIPFELEPIMHYLTSDTFNNPMPENASLFYDLFMRGHTAKNHWNTRKRKNLEYAIEGPAHDINDQFGRYSSHERSQANSMLRCLMSHECGGKFSTDDWVDDEQEGICVLFPGPVKGDRLRDYISVLIGRNYGSFPIMIEEFFNTFVKNVDCYSLIPTRVLNQFVTSDELPERKKLMVEFPLSVNLDQLVGRLNGSVLYGKARKLIYELRGQIGQTFDIEPDTRRIIYLKEDLDGNIGSTMDNMLRYLVGPHSIRRMVPFDIAVFYRDVIMVKQPDENLFGRGTFDFLQRLCDSGTPMVNRPRISPDQGQIPAKCPQCQFLFGRKIHHGNLTPGLVYEDAPVDDCKSEEKSPSKMPRYSHSVRQELQISLDNGEATQPLTSRFSCPMVEENEGLDDCCSQT